MHSRCCCFALQYNVRCSCYFDINTVFGLHWGLRVYNCLPPLWNIFILATGLVTQQDNCQQAALLKLRLICQSLNLTNIWGPLWNEKGTLVTSQFKMFIVYLLTDIINHRYHRVTWLWNSFAIFLSCIVIH